MDSTTGLKVVAGFRPLRVVGVEIAYVDFGEAGTEDNYSPNMGISLGGYSLTSKANATALAALLFIPEPWPPVDVYGKVGVAKLEESFDVWVEDWSLPCRVRPFGIDPSCMFSSQADQTGTHPYVGIGARFKVAPAWAVGLEFEGIDGEFGDATTMFSVGIAWQH